MCFFKNVNSLDSLKKEYRKLAFKNHPDRGGDTNIMQQINKEYEDLLKKIIQSDNENLSEDQKSFWESKEEHTDVEIKVKQALDKIIFLDGLEIEIIGVWIWVSGETIKYKNELKNAGFIWNRNKLKWVFMGKKSRGYGNLSIDQIREKYGSEKVSNLKKNNSYTKAISY